jgi:hypothetical protein
MNNVHLLEVECACVLVHGPVHQGTLETHPLEKCVDVLGVVSGGCEYHSELILGDDLADQIQQSCHLHTSTINIVLNHMHHGT